MNRVTAIALMSLMSAMVAAATNGAEPPAKQPGAFNFQHEMERLRSGDASVDFDKLRLGLAESKGFSPQSEKERDLRNKLVDAVNGGDCDTALEIADQILAINYLYPDAHMGALACDEAKGDTAGSAFHRAVLEGLFNSICRPDAGFTSDNPCKVIAVYEEYFVLESLGLEFKSQSQHTCAGAPCDRLVAADPASGDLVVLYFDITEVQKNMPEVGETPSPNPG